MVAEVCKRPLNPPVTAYGGEAQSLHEAGRDGAQSRVLAPGQQEPGGFVPPYLVP